MQASIKTMQRGFEIPQQTLRCPVVYTSDRLVTLNLCYHASAQINAQIDWDNRGRRRLPQ